jgi:hypothetical protein
MKIIGQFGVGLGTGKGQHLIQVPAKKKEKVPA